MAKVPMLPEVTVSFPAGQRQIEIGIRILRGRWSNVTTERLAALAPVTYPWQRQVCRLQNHEFTPCTV